MTQSLSPAALLQNAAPAAITGESSADYDVVRRTLERLTHDWRNQPSLEELASDSGLQPIQLQRVFSRWAGLTPKQFLQALTLDHAKSLLEDAATVLDTSYEVGLSGSSRLHDLFVTHEAMTPGAYRERGKGLTISYGYHPSPFGIALLMITDKGLAGLAFCEENEREAALADMTRRWPAAHYVESHEATAPFAARVFDPQAWQEDTPLRLVFIGSNFELKVWETLLSIPMGKATTYSNIAERLGNPKASRAVGTAVGRNPISFVVPCHRVLGKSGSLCGYHWGLTRKRAILGWEFGRSLSE
ncbi:methylated-DNA--[protein]-cysteine S-methyltransferase [Roseibium limicola]|uniref:methylated-DNA--[protein]-cysteine S-methyltransferase n=1 Tax=Roseibium limicola TaxID=2816037 RepID=A0A939J8G7_9HYPH|nr:bifunctional helix-turn-helix domain-containing protein/methylated-DNA--[protein]-cysteine S-methyltransferase [Roseibium limicola]MBO0347182.1 bifunctional helix-turn-helix domain-containing protein/methylated-DNA--[protein]-cysteine S-methyltransferase [Roseibium limicola]